jgi:hypothetical protein
MAAPQILGIGAENRRPYRTARESLPAAWGDRTVLTAAAALALIALAEVVHYHAAGPPH